MRPFMCRCHFLFVLFLTLLLASCSNDDSDSPNLTKDSFVGTWELTRLALAEDETQQQSLGEISCTTGTARELGASFDSRCADSQVEQCTTLDEFSISLSTMDLYDRIENYIYKNASLDADADCALTNFENDSYQGSFKGEWELSSEADELFLTETYSLIRLVNRGETINPIERFDETETSWKILEFSGNEMVIFWRTPDQIDYKMWFVKS